METHALPQNITSFEDRIIGDITVKQFAFLLAGGIAIFILVITPLPKYLKLSLGGLIAVFSAGMAFLKIEGRSLDVWALNFIFAIYSPTQMIWQKRELIPAILAAEAAPQKKKEKAVETKKTREEFEGLLNFFSPILTEEKLDPAEKTFLSSLDFKTPIKGRLLAAIRPEIALPPPSVLPPPPDTGLYLTPPPLPTPSPPPSLLPPPLPPSPKGEELKKELEKLKREKEEALAYEAAQEKKIAQAEREKALAEIEKLKREVKKVLPPPPPPPPRGKEMIKPLEAVKKIKIEEKRKPVKLPEPAKAIIPPLSKRVIMPLASEINFLEKPVFRTRTPEGQTHFVSALTNVRISRGLHRLPPTRATLILPILGEKKLKVSKELEERLVKPSPIKLAKPVEIAVKPPPPKPAEPAEPAELAERVKQAEERKMVQAEKEKTILQAQLSDLTKELDGLRERLKELSSKNVAYDQKLEEKLKELEENQKEKEEALAEIEKLKREVKLPPRPPKYIEIQKPSLPRPVKQARPVVKKAPSKKEAKLTITNLPNAINGVVIAPDGSFLENVIVVIKDENENPARALKTNKLGQFAIATPLPNGVYTIEFEKDNYKFDIIEITISGKAVPPVEIQAKV